MKTLPFKFDKLFAVSIAREISQAVIVIPNSVHKQKQGDKAANVAKLKVD